MTGRRSARKPDDQPSGAAVADNRSAPDRPPPPHQPGPHQGQAPPDRTAPPHRPRHDGPATPDGSAPPPPAPAQARRGRRNAATGPVVPAPAPAPTLPGSPGGTAGAGPDTEDPSAQAGVAPVEVEPTTGAPLDALPRRVPVRQPKRWHRGGRATAGGTAKEDDSTFWAPIEEVHWDGTPIRAEPERERDDPTRRRRARATHPPDPLPGLAALLALSLVAAFFAWVSAGPLWLALGHSTEGRVAISDCTGGGLTQRCRGIFTADEGRFLAHGVRISGVPAERAAPGATLPARMTGPDGDTAYADRGLARHLRWMLGLLMVAACGAGIARWTGATRLGDRRARRCAVGAAFGGPALITLGFLAAAW
ncbi:hypothetical protein ACFOOK_25170 [Micromonospora krabiensis]|uniref:hypothetical protein n=1 Tax=Micromonospora krabiensis TaxID=307121 RepID=UPI000AFDE5C8|nr:hypothetical protein [Micromonospora krabiensis]